MKAKAAAKGRPVAKAGPVVKSKAAAAHGAKPKPSAGAAPAARGAHKVRIIGGAWKRTPLAVPDVEGLRPTPDRVRETLFNWLGGSLEGLACLDLFAGTGALGLEAASRGAREVWLVEPDRRAQRAIGDAIARLGAAQVRLMPMTSAQALAQARVQDRRFDLVFLDPPFGQGWLEKVLPELRAVLGAGARVYIENDAALDEAGVTGLLGADFRIARAGRAGQVHYHLILRSTPQEAQT